MSNFDIKEALYEKYIKPTKRVREFCAGIEIEMPVVNMSGKAVDEKITINAAKAFSEHFGFTAVSKDDNGNVNSIEDDILGDNLSFDCSYSNLELSMGKAYNLFEVKERFERYYEFLSKYFEQFNYVLTGMGINPNYNINHNLPVPNERYRMLYHYLHSYKRHKGEYEKFFHNHPDFGTFTSASQVQIDVRYDDILTTIDTFGRVEPYKALLFSNSYMKEYPKLMCSRNMLWGHSMQGYNPHNVGMFEEMPKTIDQLLEYISSTSIYCTMRNGRYIDFTPIPINEYFSRSSVTGEYYDGECYREITFRPEPQDIEYLRTFKFEDLTYRGTIEYRSTCCQPISDSMTIAAFHLGLSEEISGLKEILDYDKAIYNHGYTASELQKLFSKRDIPSFINRNLLRQQLFNILDLASSGLSKREKDEEKLLEPLYERAEKLTNPAKELVSGLENGKTLEEYIYKYGALNVHVTV